jgi:hypothetical protein
MISPTIPCTCYPTPSMPVVMHRLLLSLLCVRNGVGHSYTTGSTGACACPSDTCHSRSQSRRSIPWQQHTYSRSDSRSNINSHMHHMPQPPCLPCPLLPRVRNRRCSHSHKRRLQRHSQAQRHRRSSRMCCRHPHLSLMRLLSLRLRLRSLLNALASAPLHVT